MFQMCSTAVVVGVDAVSPTKPFFKKIHGWAVGFLPHVSLDKRVELVDRLNSVMTEENIPEKSGRFRFISSKVTKSQFPRVQTEHRE